MNELNEKLYTQLVQAFRAAGATFNTTNSMQQLRTAAKEIGELISKEAARAAGDVGNQIQERLKDGTDRIAKDIEALETRVDTLTEEVAGLYSGENPLDDE